MDALEAGMMMVSIHARQFHSGRPDEPSGPAGLPVAFQSTPANFTAGDKSVSTQTPDSTSCFNPRPPISQRATG